MHLLAEPASNGLAWPLIRNIGLRGKSKMSGHFFVLADSR